MADLTKEQVAHLAQLARLDLTSDELEHYSEQLNVILAAVAQVGEVATDDVPATSHPIIMTNVFRADKVTPGLSREEVLSGAPSVQDDRFRVPRILQEEPS
jgi:aspartyl-tRNA(Asn)/glutamyl-tRNA(Gln) amidotransferase subunit C